MNDLINLLGDPVEHNEYIIKPINGRWWIEHKHVGSGEPLEQFLNKVECNHPFSFVMSKCNGEINHCLKCGKTFE